jgi:hypothetical protein
MPKIVVDIYLDGYPETYYDPEHEDYQEYIELCREAIYEGCNHAGSGVKTQELEDYLEDLRNE